MRVLEARLGVRLLHRTTRSVAPTQAGEQLATHLRPILHDLAGALAAITAFRGQPAGRLRINATEPATRLLLRSVVPAFLRRCPEMSLDLVTEGRLVPLVIDRDRFL